MPKKKEEPGSATGLKAKDVLLISSKRSSLLLSGASEINVMLLLSPFGKNGNFPVVGDGCACSANSWKKQINKTIILLLM
jgi:CO dehydrogenase nickel-insertion accessory protein CooC1